MYNLDTSDLHTLIHVQSKPVYSYIEKIFVLCKNFQICTNVNRLILTTVNLTMF